MLAPDNSDPSEQAIMRHYGGFGIGWLRGKAGLLRSGSLLGILGLFFLLPAAAKGAGDPPAETRSEQGVNLGNEASEDSEVPREWIQEILENQEILESMDMLDKLDLFEVPDLFSPHDF
jgi:hypothetical protein